PERAAAKPHVRAATADPVGFAASVWRDPPRGESLGAKANRPARATQSPGANCSGNSWDGNITGGDSIPDSRGAKNRASANGEYRGQERFARTQHRRRECSLPRRDFKPRRGREELAAQELQG